MMRNYWVDAARDRAMHELADMLCNHFNISLDYFMNLTSYQQENLSDLYIAQTGGAIA